MGAARFRWFHEFGCCECIDSTCLDYGKGEALCTRCSADHLGDDGEDEVTEADVVSDENEEIEYDDSEDVEADENRVTGVPPLQVEEEQVVQEVTEHEKDRSVLGATAQLNAVDSLDNL